MATLFALYQKARRGAERPLLRNPLCQSNTNTASAAPVTTATLLLELELFDDVGRCVYWGRGRGEAAVRI